MALFETWLKNDLKKPIVVEKLKGNLFSSDSGANLIGVEVLDNGAAASLTGGVMGYAIREDGYTVTISGTLSNNKASIVLNESCYTVPGLLSIVIKVGSTTVGAVVANVYRTTTESVVDPGHLIPSIEELLEKIADCDAATAAANTAASSANTAAGNANAKAELADDAATLANAKAGLANDAATLANTKAGLADDAATLANTKAGLANDAAALATTKAGLADDAATDATIQAQLAGDAANAANSAAYDATAAASTANTAAGKINNMTADAESVASTGSADAIVSEVSGHKHIHFKIPRGTDGRDGIVAQIDMGLFSMAVNSDGDLICTYSTDPPALAIDENGDLIYTV